jgi:hypothetical protein
MVHYRHKESPVEPGGKGREMPFDKNTAAAAGSKGGKGRWAGKDPSTVRNTQLKVKVTEREKLDIEWKALEAGLSMTELIIQACQRFRVR